MGSTALVRTIPAFAIAFSFVFSSFAVAAFPAATWETRVPSELGLQADKLDALALTLGGRGCVIKDGYVVKSWGDQSERSDWMSSAKPVLTTMLMFALKEGRIQSFDQPIADFGWELHDKDKGITFRHLANMTSGYARPEAAGAAYAYNDFAIQLYQSTLFDKVFRNDAKATVEDPSRLGALGFEDGLVFSEKRRIKASVRDFARIVWLWQCKGKWGDSQLLPEQYFVDEMHPQVPADFPLTQGEDTGDYLGIGSYGGGSDQGSYNGVGVYGFNWWFNEKGGKHPDSRLWPDAPADTVMSLGFGGNCSAILPSHGIVLVNAKGNWDGATSGEPASPANQALRLLVAATGATPATPYAMTGESRKWRPLTFSFEGPESSETSEVNPFTEYRLEVTFTHKDKTYHVPGYFAADGIAAESGGESGNTWRAHFTPDEAGDWHFKVSFRKGPMIAISDDPAAGEVLAFDGIEGDFNVKGIRKEKPETYDRGRVVYTGERYPRYAETKQPFLKAGADSPENWLAYDGIDGTKPTHRFEPHIQDWKDGDPVWHGDKGKGLIGSLNYLASHGMNSVYFITMNVKGDGKDVWPWTGPDERFRFDCSKLDQWEIVFQHMDKLGIMLHILTQEQENDQLLDEGELGDQRKLYYRELIARFSHHLAITWNLGEENTNTADQSKAFSTYFQQHDPYKSLVVIHTFPSKYEEIYAPLLGHKDLTGASLQVGNQERVHKVANEWIRRSKEAGHPWAVFLDEIGPANRGVPLDADEPSQDYTRRHSLWGALMAGCAGVEWFFGYDTNMPKADVQTEDWRTHETIWVQTRYATDFFFAHVPFTEMENADKAITQGGAWCLAKEGEVYLVYAWEPSFALNVAPGAYTVVWFNPKTGGDLTPAADVDGSGGSVALTAPATEGSVDWVALIKKK